MQPSPSTEQLEKRKIGKRRRLKLFTIVMVLFLLWAGSIWLQQQEELNKQQEELVLVQDQVKKAKEHQLELTDEIKRLHDPEYIGEVARRDYFLSGPGEMIFKIPEK